MCTSRCIPRASSGRIRHHGCVFPSRTRELSITGAATLPAPPASFVPSNGHMRIHILVMVVLASVRVAAQDTTDDIRTLFPKEATAAKGGYFSVGTGYTQVMNSG